jgi:Dolichyl-phosphate-mannose-protein mannosyltransferase
MPRANSPSSTNVLLFYISAATIFLHLLVSTRYGFHRDELALIEDARHLAWGYVAYPPLTPFLARLSLTFFSTSIIGLRLFSSVLQAIAVFLTAKMTQHLGGNREAQILAALAAVPFCLGLGALMQYTSFDYFFWVLASYFLVRLLASNDPRWFLPVGAAIGLGMMTKYTMLFFSCGILAGILFTDARRLLRTKWLWLGLAISLLIFLPNFLWQARHHFIALDFLHFLHQRDVATGLTSSFLPDQFMQTLLACPLWLAGLYFYFFTEKGRPFRALGWVYLVPLILFVIARGRGYYLAPAYPMLYAAGAVFFADTFPAWRTNFLRFARPALWTALLISILGAIVVGLPIAPIGSRWYYTAVQIDSSFPDEIGWLDFVSNLAKVRDSLPPEKQSRLGLLVENYGEAGAINLYGERFGLPRAISGVNSSWERGYGAPPPETVIVVGFTQDFVNSNFDSCHLAAHTWNSFNIPNEETIERSEIYVCGPPLQGWPTFWQSFQYFAERPPSGPAVVAAAF